MDLFSARAAEIGAESAPLAARMRPRSLEEFVGQAHVLGPGSALRALIEADELRSVILWGPAGTGKTSLAHIVAIHRFNKAQQDALLPGVEDRTVVLIGATTENPFFALNTPLMSRSLLFR